MLEDAVDAFLRSVNERAFDQPLMALLRAEGYEDVRLTHGRAEFGRDVIAKRDGEQWAWQSKAGDVGQGDFRQMTGQLDELRLSRLAHPDFDADLPLRAVLVTTGRLTGNAPLSMREYNERAADRGEVELEHWGRDILVGKLAGNPDAVLRGSMDGQVLSFIGAARQHSVDLDSLERLSGRWASWEPTRLIGLAVVECAVVCEELRRNDRLDLACQLGLCAVQAFSAATVEATDVDVVEAAGRVFDAYAAQLWDECDDRLLQEKGLVNFSGLSAWVSYPIRCLRTAELVALYGLRCARDNPTLAREIGQWLIQFVRAQPGTAQPIGDRYAVSLVPSALLLHSVEPEAANELLHRASVWVSDRYEVGQLGLAGHTAPAEEEIERLLGASFESVDRERRRASHAAAVILDLCASLGLNSLYRDARNDFQAVNAYPAVLLTTGRERLTRDAPASRWELNPDYSDELGDGAPVPHLEDSWAEPALQLSEAWQFLAVSAALRDRHFPAAIRSIATGLVE